MNSRERILAAINHQPVDRVPTDIWATTEVWDMLRARFGTEEAAREALHIDGPLLLSVLAVCAVGLVVLYSAAGEDIHIFVGQAARVGLGLGVLTFVAQIPPRVMRIGDEVRVSTPVSTASGMSNPLIFLPKAGSASRIAAIA